MNRQKQLSAPDFLIGGGEMGGLIAAKDWSMHPLGPIDSWPQSLKISLGICLRSPLPTAIYWGKKLHILHNDAWRPIFDNKYRAALGRPAKEVWAGRWKVIGPAALKVYKHGKGSLSENMYLPMSRNGLNEECYFNYACSPIYGEDKKIGGLLNTGHETTQRLLAERRHRVARRLYEKTFGAESPEAACIHISNLLSEGPYDVPFALFYLLNPDKASLRLAASTSIDSEHPVAMQKIDLKKKNNIFPFARVFQTGKQQITAGLDTKYSLPGGAWEENSREAALIPIRNGGNELYGVLVLGISPRLVYDTFYKEFFKQLAEQTAFAVGAAYDLRRKLTMESRENETRRQLQAALSSNLVGVWTWDIPENRVYADQNLAYQLGIDNSRPDAGVPASAFLESIHSADKMRINKNISEAVSKTKRFEAEYRLFNRNKELRWVISRGKVETGPDGKAVRFSGVTVDITNHKNTEIELAATEHMFSALFQSSIIGVAVASVDGRLHEANETFLRMFGYTKRDLSKGLTSEMITPPSSRDVTSLIYRELRKKGEADPIEKEFRRKDGSIIPTLVGAVMIPDSNDRFIAFILDISEQKQLLELNKAKDEFIAIASHQLRTPATGVKQYLGMLLEGYAGDIKDSQREILNIAYQSNERQLTIVNDLLRVAQADAHEVKLKRVPTNIVTLIKNVVEEQSPKFTLKNQKVSFSPRRQEVKCLCDPYHIRMVLENIIDNAHKYTPENKQVKISLSSNSKTITVKIKDEGVGIRKKDLPKLFQKFSRINNPLSMAAGGTGLGLYWVNKIITLHGGTVLVSSKHKKGSEFVITLPVGVT